MRKNILEERLQALLNNFTGEDLERDKWDGYLQNFLKLAKKLEGNGSLVWDEIKPPNRDSILNYSDLNKFDKLKISEYLNKLVVVKLNGGLGTTLGCNSPKSLIVVRDGKSFFDMTLDQLEFLNKTYNTKVPLILMNSFNTNKQMEGVIEKYKSYITPIHMFVQDQCPRLWNETHLPLADEIDEKRTEWWYPPGHGNFYHAFYNSGFLKKFQEDGKRYAFISNIDNLGATVDLNILSFIMEQREDDRNDFVAEVTNKTKSDIKGGTIINYKGTTRLLEIAQVPKEHEEDFKSVSKFRVFNTNNLWVNLQSIKELIDNDEMDLDLIVNKKVLSDSSRIVQLETAIGAAIKNFKRPISINVLRDRFLPVKNNSDLFLVMSNIYQLSNGYLEMSSLRHFQTTPFVNFSGDGFKQVDEFLKRFSSIPDILDLDHLTVAGDVTFGSGVSLKGTVVIIAQQGDKIDIPSGSIFENKIVTGSLRILSN